MLAWQAYQRTLCKGCGQEKAKAWHPDNEGHFSVEMDDAVICWGCTALKEAEHEDSSESVEPVRYPVVIDDRDYEAKPLPPLIA